MVKQRQESARAYEEGGRLELAEKELSEIKIIEDFLPRQLSAAETQTAIDAAIAEVGAQSIRDMGKVMAVLKDRYHRSDGFCQGGSTGQVASGLERVLGQGGFHPSCRAPRSAVCNSS